ncbi:putative PhoH-like protein [Bacillus phage JL]|uniref:PhoH-like protein n=1 Tax=Bacillus phage JL TaxID=1296655 RepID=S5MSH9_9CAUD|nr:putative PhoH-like protein [Bacillus phage JL]AGR46757.1 putative PhoH-like protein [Bacillus phage JL]
MKHWEHTEVVDTPTYKEFLQFGTPIIPKVQLPFNTAVYVVCDGGSKVLEGIYDKTVDGIRPLKDTKAPNRDLRLYKDAIQSEHITVLAVDGLMGTGKTSTIVEALIKKHLSNVHVPDHLLASGNWKPDPDVHKILISKPAVNAGEEEYGFLPGDINEKMIPTLRNYTQYFDRNHQAGFNNLNTAGYVEVLPLGFVRGMDAMNTDLVVDECQNTKELVTIVSRRSENSRIFLIGDTSPFQIDLKGNAPTKNGLSDIIDLLQGAPYFQYIEMKSLENIVRSYEVRDLVRRLFKKHGTNPQEWLS